MISSAACPIRITKGHLLCSTLLSPSKRTRSILFSQLLSCHYNIPSPVSLRTNVSTPIGLTPFSSSLPLLSSSTAPFPFKMAQTRLHSTKNGSTPTKETKPENGNKSNGHEHHEHDADHEEHTHSHSIFGHSHSHGEEGHAHDAEQIIAALKGTGACYSCHHWICQAITVPRCQAIAEVTSHWSDCSLTSL